MTNAHQSASTSTPTSANVAVDLNNVKLSPDGAFERIDIGRFCARARAEVGRDCAIKVFANEMSSGEESVWARHGAEVIRTRVNADPVIEDCLFEASNSSQILIASGDHAFANAARWHAHLHHRVIIWARRAKAAYELVCTSGASRIDFIDDLILPPVVAPRRRTREAVA